MTKISRHVRLHGCIHQGGIVDYSQRISQPPACRVSAASVGIPTLARPCREALGGRHCRVADKDIRIAKLEATVQLLTASHLAMLRAVGELGGFSKWARFYEQYSQARDKLIELGAVPAATVSPMEPNSRARPTPANNQRKR